MEHTGPICGALGHFVGTLTIVWCPHHQGWELVVHAGDDADDCHWRSERISFGPFDDLDQVVGRAQSEVARLARADKSAWVAAREARG